MSALEAWFARVSFRRYLEDTESRNVCRLIIETAVGRQSGSLLARLPREWRTHAPTSGHSEPQQVYDLVEWLNCVVPAHGQPPALATWLRNVADLAGPRIEATKLRGYADLVCERFELVQSSATDRAARARRVAASLAVVSTIVLVSSVGFQWFRPFAVVVQPAADGRFRACVPALALFRACRGLASLSFQRDGREMDHHGVLSMCVPLDGDQPVLVTPGCRAGRPTRISPKAGVGEYPLDR